MLISQLGEWGLIEKISSKFHRNLPEGNFGIGDDTAILPLRDNLSLLVTTDMLGEDSHFLRSEISPRELGHKALAVNLSDIAAMGGKPTAAFLSLGLTKNLTVDWIDEFFQGFQELADRHSVTLMGGDTTESKKGIVLNVTVLGEIETSKIKMRSHARPGDLICVTGNLGDSAAGLRYLLEKKTKDALARTLIQRHHKPKPYVTEGQWLSSQPGIHAMMDISDGLDLTLREISQKSNCGAEIHFDQLPISEELKVAAAQFNWNAMEFAAAGGEDYCLFVTVDENEYSKLKTDYSKEFASDLTAVGKITDRPQHICYFQNGKPYESSLKTWNHFKSESSLSDKT